MRLTNVIKHSHGIHTKTLCNILDAFGPEGSLCIDENNLSITPTHFLRELSND